MREKVENLHNLSKEERINTVKNPEFRKALFEDKNHYPFVWCVQGLEGEEILSLLDDDILPYLEKDRRLKDKLNAIVTSNNPYINVFLSSDKAISLIIKEINTLRTYLPALDINFGKKYVSYLIDNNLDITYLGYLNRKVQVEVLKDKSIYNRIMMVNLPKNFLSSLNPNAIEYLLNDKYFENVLLTYDASGLNYLFERGLSLPIHLQENKEIIDKFANIENINITHAYLERLGDNNPYLKEHIMKKRKELYLEKVQSIDKELKIFSKYKDYLYHRELLTKDEDPRVFYIISRYEKQNDRLKYLQLLTETVMLEMIIDSGFEDMTYNFLKNIQIILNYTKKTSEKIVSEENLSIYEKIYNFYNLSFEDKLTFFNNMMNKSNMIESFYDDFRNVLNHSYENISNNLLKLNKENELEVIEDIPVYRLEGEPFYMLIHNTTELREGNPYNIWHDKSETASLSLIGETHLETFRNPYEDIILGFSDIDINTIMHVYKSDSYSARGYGTDKIPSIMTPKELLDNTRNYNEILMKEDGKLHPSYIVCYDEVKSGDIKASKILGNIPLVIIDTKKYNTTYEMNALEENDKYKSINESFYPISYKKGR